MTTTKKTVLIVDDDPDYLQSLTRALGREFTVVSASSIPEANRRLNEEVSLVLLDIVLREDDKSNRDGLVLLESIKQVRPEMPVVMMTAYGDIDLAIEAMRRGATDFIQKERVDIREFRKVLQNAWKRANLERRLAEVEDDYRRLEPWELVGDDPQIHEVRRLVDMVAEDGFCTVLIRGETGTGKELVARAIHSRGRRKEGPFVTVHLPALNPDIIESELFGHVKGAFTDARDARVGYLEKAKNGIVFLDEIGELNTHLQPKLLRAIETKTFARVGSTEELTVDTQVVCATNRDMEEAVKQGQVREDFYFRLKTFEIRIPPLRERSGDIPLLTDHFLFLFRQQGRTRLAGIQPAALESLAAYPFPGNVRELRSIMERAMMLASSNRHTLIEVSDLPLEVQHPSNVLRQAMSVTLPDEGVNLDGELARVELSYIEEALRQTEGKKTDAWRLLGLNDRFALRRRVKRLMEAYPQLVGSFQLVKQLYEE